MVPAYVTDRSQITEIIKLSKTTKPFKPLLSIQFGVPQLSTLRFSPLLCYLKADNSNLQVSPRFPGETEIFMVSEL